MVVRQIALRAPADPHATLIAREAEVQVEQDDNGSAPTLFEHLGNGAGGGDDGGPGGGEFRRRGVEHRVGRTSREMLPKRCACVDTPHRHATG